MTNLPRRHIEARRTERTLLNVIIAVASLILAGVIGSVLIDLYANIATALGNVLTHTPGR